MDRAFAATGFLISLWAMFKAVDSVVEQLRALRTQLIAGSPVDFTAIDGYHHCDYSFLSVNAVHAGVSWLFISDLAKLVNCIGNRVMSGYRFWR